MALNINLYVHGVPMGHKTWGVLGEDSSFITNFYSQKWQAKELMQVDIMNCEGKTYSYYTFIKGQNVVAYDNRAGSYFALTIRMDAYYADLQNMYKILSAAYEKMCVGRLVQKQGEGIKFIVQDFSVLDAELRHIENRIISYIGDFSNNTDLISFSGFKTNGQQAAITENLLECDNTKALNTVKATGKISVSPYYHSKEVKELISKKENEMRNLQQMTSQQINEVHEKASQQIRNIESKANDEIESVRRQANEDMKLLKSQYSTVDKQIKDLELKLQQEKDNSKKLQKEVRNELEQKLQQEKDNSKKLQKEVKRLTISSKQNEENISNAGCNSNPHQGLRNKRNGILSSILPFLNTIIIVCTASILIWNIAELKDQISGKKAQVVETRKQDKGNVANKFSNAKIDINNANFLHLEAPSKVVVKDANGKPVKNGKWTTSDKAATIEDKGDGTALITAKKSGTMEIIYTVGSESIKKTVTVK